MFFGCSSLKELDATNFNTNYAKEIKYMFYKCSDELRIYINKKYRNITDEAFN